MKPAPKPRGLIIAPYTGLSCDDDDDQIHSHLTVQEMILLDPDAWGQDDEGVAA
jgi:hypothetical protein